MQEIIKIFEEYPGLTVNVNSDQYFSFHHKSKPGLSRYFKVIDNKIKISRVSAVADYGNEPNLNDPEIWEHDIEIDKENIINIIDEFVFGI